MIRVAIVEDDAEVQGVLQEYVRRYTRQYGTEFEVTVFADGVDILEDYRAVYDIIFLDVEMKHLAGLSAWTPQPPGPRRPNLSVPCRPRWTLCRRSAMPSRSAV